MKAIKVIAILLGIYIGIVVLFESLIGYFQPESENTLVITTQDADGTRYNRVLSLLTHNDQLYISVNHWPRAWYHRVVDNPDIQVSIKGEVGDYTAVILQGAQYDEIAAAFPQGTVFRILTGFPPRQILRLDPKLG